MNRTRLVSPYAFLALGAPIAVFLQSTLLAGSLPGGVTPNLGFLLAVAAGYFAGGAAGAAFGLWVGAWLGAAAGSLAAPLACLYGTLGWLAGLHSERRPERWTYAVATFSLALIMVSGECWISLALDGFQSSLHWSLTTVGWCTLLGLPMVGFRGLDRHTKA